MRHPHLPEIRRLGDASSRDELARLVRDSLADPDPDSAILAAVEWLDIFEMDEAVLGGSARSRFQTTLLSRTANRSIIVRRPLGPLRKILAVPRRKNMHPPASPTRSSFGLTLSPTVL